MNENEAPSSNARWTISPHTIRVLAAVLLAGSTPGFVACSDEPTVRDVLEAQKREAEEKRAAEARERREAAAREKAERDAEAAIAARPPDELADEAERILESGAEGNIRDARLMIERVPTAQRKRPKVRKVLAQIEKAEHAQQRQARQDYANAYDSLLTKRGIEADVKIAGSDGSTLRIESFICGKVFLAREFDDEGTANVLRTLGFKRIACDGGLATYSEEL